MSLLERTGDGRAAWCGSLPVTSRYTFGLAGERFFRALKDEGKFLGSRCSSCGITYVPGRQFCERSMEECDEWLDVGTHGVVETFTVLHVNYDGSPSDEPTIVAFVRIADGGIVHKLGDVAPEDVVIGMPVEAVLMPPEERIGSMLDISYFKPE
jgi:uncharacterized OB-fold protein